MTKPEGSRRPEPEPDRSDPAGSQAVAAAKRAQARTSRRDFGKTALAALSATRSSAAPRTGLGQGKPEARPNSVFGGVRIGVIAPYSFGPEATSLADILAAVVRLGISRVELSNAPIEAFAGAPAPPPPPSRGRTPTPAESDAANALTRWRTAASMDRFEAVRALYAKAGVAIYAYRLTLTDAMPDDEYEYAFTAARALGADQLTMELPADGRLSQRIGRFAARHRTLAGYHAHTQATLTAWDEALAQSKYNAVQLDVGHYVAGTSASPIPLLRKHHDRIASLHLKDRKRGNHDGGPNMPWGQGDTPIREVLQLMRAERWTFPAAIELEYPVPAGSTRFAEIARCLDYCKQALA